MLLATFSIKVFIAATHLCWIASFCTCACILCVASSRDEPYLKLFAKTGKKDTQIVVAIRIKKQDRFFVMLIGEK